MLSHLTNSNKVYLNLDQKQAVYKSLIDKTSDKPICSTFLRADLKIWVQS